MSNQNPVTLTAEQLKDILSTAVAAAVAESRKPLPLTEKELAEQTQARADRESTARLQLEKLKRDQANREACTHRRKDRTTHCVFEYNGGYLICQGCQAIIHPEPRPTGPGANETSHHLYNTRMFNEHFSEAIEGNATFA